MGQWEDERGHTRYSGYRVITEYEYAWNVMLCIEQQYQAELTFPAEFVPGKEKAGGGAAAQSTAYTPTPTTPPETKRLTEQAVLLAVAIFLVRAP